MKPHHLRDRRAATAAFTLAVGAMVSCGVVTDPTVPTEWEVRTGIVEFYQEAAHVEVPDIVDAGVAFVVRVRTFGGGCIAQARGPTLITRTGAEATVAPLDSVIVRSPQTACTDDLRLFEHQVPVTFPDPGTAAIIVLGRREPEGTDVEIVRTVEVRNPAS